MRRFKPQLHLFQGAGVMKHLGMRRALTIDEAETWFGNTFLSSERFVTTDTKDA